MTEWSTRRLEEAMRNAPVVVEYKRLISDLASENAELKEETLALRQEIVKLRDWIEYGEWDE